MLLKQRVEFEGKVGELQKKNKETDLKLTAGQTAYSHFLHKLRPLLESRGKRLLAVEKRDEYERKRKAGEVSIQSIFD